MTNRELIDAAWAEMLTATITPAQWKDRVDNGYKGKPYNWQNTAYGRAKGFLDQIQDCPVVPPPPEFAEDIPQPPPIPTTPPTVVSTEAQFLAAKNTPGVIAINGRIVLTGETKLSVPGVAIVPANGPLKDALLCAPNGVASLKLLTDRVWIHDLELGGGSFDGIRLGDGVKASNVDVAGCWIHDVGEQGVLIATTGADDVWVRGCLIENVGKSKPLDARIGHGVYLGGPSARLVVQHNTIRPTAFGVHCYPNPTDVLVTQNSIEGGTTRGGFEASGATRNVRFVGNIIKGSATAAFEIGNGCTGFVDDNLVWQCAHGIWEPGYVQLPGGNNLVADPALNAKGFVRPVSYGWVTSADAGAPPFTLPPPVDPPPVGLPPIFAGNMETVLPPYKPFNVPQAKNYGNPVDTSHSSFGYWYRDTTKANTGLASARVDLPATGTAPYERAQTITTMPQEEGKTIVFGMAFEFPADMAGAQCMLSEPWYQALPAPASSPGLAFYWRAGQGVEFVIATGACAAAPPVFEYNSGSGAGGLTKQWACGGGTKQPDPDIFHQFIMEAHLARDKSGTLKVLYRPKGAADWVTTVDLANLATLQYVKSSGSLGGPTVINMIGCYRARTPGKPISMWYDDFDRFVTVEDAMREMDKP